MYSLNFIFTSESLAVSYQPANALPGQCGALDVFILSWRMGILVFSSYFQLVLRANSMKLKFVESTNVIQTSLIQSWLQLKLVHVMSQPFSLLS